ncbi:hypothetical protein HPB50_001616 [Hyalomma asiaticum]|uniref:Uncharacterized protein n=1 Tax=Hyalomma asiaticum TaxID=266040 RepID=A0ACB7RWQ4_HYAAI|nr:hypothetical protein HPB50_001616 [Hyalomma asiaticum]
MASAVVSSEATTTEDDPTEAGEQPSDDKPTKERKLGRVLSNSLPSRLHAEDYDSDEAVENDHGGNQQSHNQSHNHHHGAKALSLHHDSEAAVQHGPRHRQHNGLPQREDNMQLKRTYTKGGRDLNVHVHVMGLKVNDSARDHRAFMHGMHVHQLGNLSDGCQSTGPHFNPTNTTHGDRRSTVRHVGDFGNIACDKHGESNVIFTDTVASLTGPHSIVGRSINIHARMDDLGRNPDNPASVSSGDSGPRVACCIIEKVDKLPQLSSKAARRILRDIMQPFSDFESE